jgi:hypothetical protein
LEEFSGLRSNAVNREDACMALLERLGKLGWRNKILRWWWSK